MILVDMQRISPEQYLRVLAENMIQLWRKGYSYLGKDAAISITHDFLASRGIHVVEQFSYDNSHLAKFVASTAPELSPEHLHALIQDLQIEMNAMFDQLKRDTNLTSPIMSPDVDLKGLVSTIDEIDPDDRSTASSLADHGLRIYGPDTGSAPKSLAAKVKRKIRSGEVRAYQLGRETYILDVRTFPDAAVRRRLQSVRD